MRPRRPHLRRTARAPGAVLAILLGLVLVVAACGSARDVVRADGPTVRPTPSAGPTGATPSPTATATGSVPSPTAPPTAPTSAPPVDLPGVVGGITSFSTPTGNIGCYLGTRGARCDIRERSYVPPPEPGSCGLAWGSSLEVGADGAGFACVGDTVLGSGTVLKYDNSTVVGDFGCTSRRTGVTCLHRPTGHGFTLSRDAARTF